MRKKRLRHFYIPVIDFWRWDQLTDTFLRVQLDRVRGSFSETESLLSTLDERVNELAHVVKNEWSKGTPYLKRQVEDAYAEIKAERKRTLDCQERLVPIIDRIKSELKRRRIDVDAKLPV